MTLELDALVVTLKQTLPPTETIGLHEPTFSGSEWTYLKSCLDSGWVSSVGAYVTQFEKELASFTGVAHAVATVNGTAALHVALQLAGVERGDEVLIPTLTFVATANAVVYCGAIPHFIDSEVPTLGLDPRKLEDYLVEIAEVRDGTCLNRRTGKRIRAVIAMHTLGHPVDLDPLAELCERYCLALVEDAAESLGSYYKGRHTGNWGKLAALSFNGNKIITTGGGGAILTDDETLARQAKHLTTTAKLPHSWAFQHDEVGYNYRLPNLNAALGCAQIEQLPDLLAKKRILAERYRHALERVEGVSVVVEPSFARSNYWLNALLLDDNQASLRDACLERLHAEGIMARPAWTLMHRLPMFDSCPRGDLAVAESLERRLITLPSSPRLVEAHA